MHGRHGAPSGCGAVGAAHGAKPVNALRNPTWQRGCASAGWGPSWEVGGEVAAIAADSIVKVRGLFDVASASYACGIGSDQITA